MPEEIQTTVKVPIMEIVASLRKKHELPTKLTGVRLEGNNIVLNFASGEHEQVEIWKSSETKNRRESAMNSRSMNDNPMESVEPMSDDSMDIAESMAEEEPNDNGDRNEGPMETEQDADEESIEDEKARERRRFWRK